ncbi:pseudaminic acid cytidylyltransferase [Geofilum rubicundum]|uniref:N-acetylneuraminate cytidylyltransferase n=1 Tax=Geofilum rubicundum JCM 15548 TaxID=1236989 RepID=A0A0E9LYV1_9BACT|nr:pseudaminic acid cytidylyltransferase [Geofilum rubicundum]GAO30463.1 N-acetylneuraminate cytidylyltransferase [Geofilum rubicundum JCM 15548]
MSTIAIIPARGGSKRIPRKNIKDFLGKPIIAYSIEAAKASKLFDEIMVSTDDEEIAKIAQKYGAKVPFFRTKEASNDFATLADVIIEVLNEYKKSNQIFETICCILPTAPLINSSRIIEAYNKLNNKDLDSLCPVVAFTYPIYRALQINENNNLEMIWPEYLITRSQDLKPAYHDSGSFYWIKNEALMQQKSLFCMKCGAIIIPEMEVQDIDTIEDWEIAELKFRIRNDEKKNNIPY